MSLARVEVLPRPQQPTVLERVRGRTTLTVSEAAEVLGIGRNSCYEAVHRGEIPSLTFGSRIVIPVAPLLRLLGVEGS